MHFGIFVEELRHGATQASAAWGVDCVWLGEIHFAPTRSIISASLQVASAIAARTRRVRVGTAVQVLPLHHPLRIAEEVATVDQISEGRFEFGIGRSGVVRTYDTCGVPYGESQARFREALDIVRRAWTSSSWKTSPSTARPTAATPSSWSRRRCRSPARWERRSTPTP
ncbi:MAG: LLM class flavin-dependent oxidoreductase [Candidatus Rokuibacteriota bacterium]